MSIFKDFQNPVIFAHRGSSAYAPENTLEAFKLARQQKADGIEFDVKLTRDKEVVCIHDQTVDRTTNGKGKVRQFTFDKIRELDAGSSFSEEHSGAKIPTLDEIIETVGKDLILNIELTNYASLFDQLPDLTAQIVKNHALEEKVLFSSFSLITLSRIKKLCPAAMTAVLSVPGEGGWLTRSWLGDQFSRGAVHPHHSDVTEDYVKRKKEAGYRVHTWTVNEEEDMRRLYKVGIDAIITDDPPKARRILEEVC